MSAAQVNETCDYNAGFIWGSPTYIQPNSLTGWSSDYSIIINTSAFPGSNVSEDSISRPTLSSPYKRDGLIIYQGYIKHSTLSLYEVCWFSEP